jgi:hypothetical protein
MCIHSIPTQCMQPGWQPTQHCSQAHIHRPHLLLAPLLLPRQPPPSHPWTRQSRGRSCRQPGCVRHRAPAAGNSSSSSSRRIVKPRHTEEHAEVGVTRVIGLRACGIRLLQQAAAAGAGAAKWCQAQVRVGLVASLGALSIGLLQQATARKSSHTVAAAAGDRDVTSSNVTAKVRITLVVSLRALCIGLLQQVDQATAARNGSSRMVSEQCDSIAVLAHSCRQPACAQHPARALSGQQ